MNAKGRIVFICCLISVVRHAEDVVICLKLLRVASVEDLQDRNLALVVNSS